MTIEEALKTAIQFENEVRDVYKGSVDRVADPIGKRVFTVLANEEQGHVDYLEDCLAKWRQAGTVTPTALETAVPSQEKIAEAIKALEKEEQANYDVVQFIADLKAIKKKYPGA